MQQCVKKDTLTGCIGIRRLSSDPSVSEYNTKGDRSTLILNKKQLFQSIILEKD